QDIHLVVSDLKTRCGQVDWIKFISNDLVLLFAEHYQQVRRSMCVFLNDKNSL
ncbi:unnamed protein product, partial [Rotaria magnacalcarata]